MKKKIIVLIILIVLIIGSVVGGVIYYINYQKSMEEQQKYEENLQKEEEILNTIKNNYSEIVKTTKETKLYKLIDDNYEEIGKISNDVNLTLNTIENITLDNKYLKLANIDYYVYYEDIIPSNISEEEKYYNNYIPFDNTIITKSPTDFYIDDKLVYSINESLQFSVIINEDDYYYVKFDDRLLAIKKDNVEKEVTSNQNTSVAEEIAVLNYHFFYDPNKGEVCNEVICLTTDKFEEQLKYLKDNGFYTATMKDMSLWMQKKIQLPKKTAVITIDDGAMGTGTHLIELLEKYDLHGTLFLITAWWPKEKYVSDNLEIQSHGNDIHNFQGEALYKTKQQLLTDFQLSIQALDGENTAFCYPFYAHNMTVRSAVKESGFQIAFVGGNRKASQSNDLYQINRYVIYSYTTLNQFINMVN